MTRRSWLCRVSDKAVKSYYSIVSGFATHLGKFFNPIFTDLGFARFPFMGGHANFIKEAMKLSYDGRNLCGEIACIHVERGARPLKRGGAEFNEIIAAKRRKKRTENQRNEFSITCINFDLLSDLTVGQLRCCQGMKCIQ